MDKNISFTLKVWRQRGPKEKGHFQTIPVKDMPGDTSFLEMLDIVNEELINKGEEPIVFDHDCREGICGMCSLYINGHPHGPATGACNLLSQTDFLRNLILHSVIFRKKNFFCFLIHFHHSRNYFS